MLDGHLFIYLFFTILLLGCFLTFILRHYLKIAVPIQRVDFLPSDFFASGSGCETQSHSIDL